MNNQVEGAERSHLIICLQIHLLALLIFMMWTEQQLPPALVTTGFCTSHWCYLVKMINITRYNLLRPSRLNIWCHCSCPSCLFSKPLNKTTKHFYICFELEFDWWLMTFTLEWHYECVVSCLFPGLWDAHRNGHLNEVRSTWKTTWPDQPLCSFTSRSSAMRTSDSVTAI